MHSAKVRHGYSFNSHSFFSVDFLCLHNSLSCFMLLTEVLDFPIRRRSFSQYMLTGHIQKAKPFQAEYDLTKITWLRNNGLGCFLPTISQYFPFLWYLTISSLACVGCNIIAETGWWTRHRSNLFIGC